MRILIVEDEERMAQTIQSLLKKQNYLSDIASDGEEGVGVDFHRDVIGNAVDER